MEEIEGYEGRLLVSDSPHVSELVSKMRDIATQGDAHRFRTNATEVGFLLAYEANKSNETRSKSIRTPLGIAEHELDSQLTLLLNILRGANPMVEGAQRIYRQAPVGFVDAKRYGKPNSDGTMPIKINYQNIPLDSFEGVDLVIPDIMLATGSSLVDTVNQLQNQYGGSAKIHVLSCIGAKDGADYVLDKLPNSRVFLAAMDPILDHRRYIVPGLGDAGDLCYNGGKA